MKTRSPITCTECRELRRKASEYEAEALRSGKPGLAGFATAIREMIGEWCCGSEGCDSEAAADMLPSHTPTAFQQVEQKGTGTL